MSAPPRVTIHIGKLRVQGGNQAQAQALASALRESLAVQLAAGPGALAGNSAERLRLTLPQRPDSGPAAVGQVAGQQIATALRGGR